MRIRVVISGPGGERSPEFGKPEVSIGRLPSNDIILPEAGVSSNHAKVVVTGGALTILDLNSTNGTFVNDEALEGPRVISEEDQVEIGEFCLRFALDGASVSAGAGPSSPPKKVSQPDAAPSWSDQPPMLDELGAPPLTPEPSAATIAAGEGSAVMFPRFEPDAPGPGPQAKAPVELLRARSAPHPRGAFEFAAAAPDAMIDQVFAAVWARAAPMVLANEGGAGALVDGWVREALEAANRVAPLPKREGLHARMVAEMVGAGPMQALLEGDPQELLIKGTGGVRVNRGGHVTEGPSPFSCREALMCFVARTCRAPFSAASAGARGHYGDYAMEAVHALDPRGTPVVSLRKVAPQGLATLEGLVQAGTLSHSIAALLATAVLARQSILLCAGPGTSARSLTAALAACAPAHELQVVVGHRGSNTAVFRPGVIVVPRGSGGAIEAALALGPDRLIVEDLQWDEAPSAMGIVSRTIGLLIGVRAHTAAAGLRQFKTMVAAPGLATGPLVAGAFDLLLTLQLFSDGVSRVTQLAEPRLDDSGKLSAQEIFSLVPGTRAWQFSGVQPRCYEDLSRRGFRLDPAIFA